MLIKFAVDWKLGKLRYRERLGLSLDFGLLGLRPNFLLFSLLAGPTRFWLSFPWLTFQPCLFILSFSPVSIRSLISFLFCFLFIFIYREIERMVMSRGAGRTERDAGTGSDFVGLNFWAVASVA